MSFSLSFPQFKYHKDNLLHYKEIDKCHFPYPFSNLHITKITCYIIRDGQMSFSLSIPQFKYHKDNLLHYKG